MFVWKTKTTESVNAFKFDSSQKFNISYFILSYFVCVCVWSHYSAMKIKHNVSGKKHLGYCIIKMISPSGIMAV